MTYLVRWTQVGPHVRASLFAGPDRDSLANCGKLVLALDEWAAMRAMLEAGAAMEELSAFGHRVELLIEEEP